VLVAHSAPRPAALPGPNTHPGDWQLHGLCRGFDPAIFFPPDDERGDARRQREMVAKSLCRQCPVQLQCRSHAVAAREPHGVWGGLSAEERRELAHIGVEVHVTADVTSTSTVRRTATIRAGAGPRSAVVSGLRATVAGQRRTGTVLNRNGSPGGSVPSTSPTSPTCS
jgi:WhiB family redox-sensing transcriptional regulator